MAKTKALISFAVIAKLICVFVFAYEKKRFSHDAAHLIVNLLCVQAGTEVGCVIIYDTTGGQLMYSTRFDSQESKYISVSSIYLWFKEAWNMNYCLNVH